ncbi:autophagy protein ATG9 KNAG_0C03900 [Huiozyma naganishii CBS 8797]|uniref:Autophagy-related protein 9 n=1 Tax=Huiozyma naganishii (strain ATCC MYA-139 / BCRC 22969 / CBS 8797 / KCTC 17520 / NBRC 10181 / NCYC 3082 / Yp74L-3) TaxID=1071383 RepID=J7S4W3_HUIN7|nr:hypothetical protein KNAG_0C03900 [Kazachstania naganishii CBS 8797]CCK69494.1 hypothetical protein KNAG_0C03900 [Kazachstania naganishii CBS 8797]
MDTSLSAGQNHNRGGRNTFLSRVFGMQSSDVTPLMNTEEMGSYPTDIEEGQPPQNREDEIRIPESDQDESSSEEEALGVTENYASGPAVAPKDRELVPLMDGTSIDSLPKLGQLSSESMNSDQIDAENEANMKEDIPLFKRTKPSPGYPVPPQDKAYKTVIGNPLENAAQRHDLFTASTNNQYQKHNNMPNSFLNFKNPAYDRHKNLRKSFIDDGKTKNTLKKPNILNNIHILNRTPLNKIHTLSPKEKALWKWANVENVDLFLQDVYNYFQGNGFTCIILQKMLNLATLIFVVYISTYLGYCIDYGKLSSSNRFKDITRGHCYSNNITGFVKFMLWVFYLFVCLKIVQLYFDFKNLTEIHNFYNYLLNISDNDLQTIPWKTVVEHMMLLKDQNALTANVVEVKAKNRIDPHDVANRIMRKSNYLIALYNNDILDLSLPLPLLRTNSLTKTLEWNINLCIIGYAFNDAGFIKQAFLKESQREYIIEELQKRFMLAGFLNIILSPFLVTYFVLLYFFRYFNEYKTSPGSLGTRQYTPMAEWKFREYNELYHLFKKRIGLSVPLADKYINQFPKEKVNIMMRFIAFIAGSFVAILGLFTILDPESFLNFEITNDRSALFYITILGTIWTIAQSSVSQEYAVFDPEETIRDVANYTHYLPQEWAERYHSEEVKQDFSKLYNLKIVILLRELGSLIITPFVLWFSLPKSASKVVDFFRETSVYVDGLGYVCKYALFDSLEQEVPPGNQNDISSILRSIPALKISKRLDDEGQLSDLSNNETKDAAINKMMQSYLYFMDDYGNEENNLGKGQISAKKEEPRQKEEKPLNDIYSWKKQFGPGRKPDLFRMERRNQNASDLRSPVQDKANNESFEPYRSEEVDESLLNSKPLKQFDQSYDNEYRSDPMGRNGGVLKLVREYYKQSDLGR